MKQNLKWTLILIFPTLLTHAQDSTMKLKKKTCFKTWITASDVKHTGYIGRLSDSVITFSTARILFNPSVTPAVKTNLIPYQQVQKMSVRRKGSGMRGLIIGGLTGMLIGIGAGLASGDDKPTPPSENFLGLADMFDMTAGQKATGGGLLGLGAGAAVGCILGNVLKKNFRIGGRKDNFQDMRQKLISKAYYTPD